MKINKILLIVYLSNILLDKFVAFCYNIFGIDDSKNLAGRFDILVNYLYKQKEC